MKRHLLKPGEKVNLSDFDPADTSGFEGGKALAHTKLLKLTEELDTLQELLYAEHRHKVLIVLQAMDTGGKDGTIRRVFEGVNPQGVRVASFKAPTTIEIDHDYLWRIHQPMPGNGEMVIFNRGPARSHRYVQCRFPSRPTAPLWTKRNRSKRSSLLPCPTLGWALGPPETGKFEACSSTRKPIR